MSDDPTKQNLDNATAASQKGRVKKPSQGILPLIFRHQAVPLRKVDLKKAVR